MEKLKELGDEEVRQVATQLIEAFLNLDRESIKKLVNTIVDEVKEGFEDSLKVFISAKKASKIFEGVLDEIKGKAAEDLKLGKSETYKKFGCKITKEVMGVKYYFDRCNDREYDLFSQKLEARKNYLKSLSQPEQLIDENTGEIIYIHPPVKTGTEGLKIVIE